LIRSIFVVILLLLQGNVVTAQTWMNPWQNRQLVPIINYNLVDLSDFQVEVNVPYHECMDSTFTDIRFTTDDGTTTLPYWERHISKGEKAVFYVKVPAMGLYSTTNLYMYFGNASAVSDSDPYSTFIYFDDFETGEGWNNFYDESVSVTTLMDSTTVLKKHGMCNDGAWKSIGDTIPFFKLLSRDYMPLDRAEMMNDNPCYIMEYGVETSTFDGVNFRRDGSNANNLGEVGHEDRENGSLTDMDVEYADQPVGEWYYSEVSCCNVCLFNTNSILWDDNMNHVSSIYDFNYNMFSFDRFVIRGGKTYYLDYIAVADKACIEPMASLGEVEGCPTAQLISYTADYCDDDDGQIVFNIQGGVSPYEVCLYKDNDSLSTLYVTGVESILLDSLAKGVYKIGLKDSAGCVNK